VFDVLFQGQAVLRRVDLVALVGARAAWQHTVPRFPVAGGRLNITFTNIVRYCLRPTQCPTQRSLLAVTLSVDIACRQLQP